MKLLDLGRMGYQAAWDIQKSVADDVIWGADDTLIFVEHDPVLTLGASFHESNLLLPIEAYEEQRIEVVRTDRGGDVTFHGPGQLVIYPVFDVKRHGADLHKWMRDLEEAIIVALTPLGIEGWRLPPHTGVWVGETERPEKVAAIGIKVRKWVSLHGIALNCDNDLSEFQLIVPCGIVGYGVTSVSKLLGRTVTIEDAKALVTKGFESVFSSIST